MSFQNLKSLLSFPGTNVKSLDISYPKETIDAERTINHSINVEILCDCLQSSHSLQTLKLRAARLKENDLSKILKSIPKTLEDLDIALNSIHTLDFDAPSTRLYRINFDGNPLLRHEASEEIDSILSFVDHHTKIEYLGERLTNELHLEELQAVLNWHRSEHEGWCACLPLSLWPTAYARINATFQRHPQRQASVLYELLKPAVGII